MSSKVLGALATTMRVWPTTVELSVLAPRRDWAAAFGADDRHPFRDLPLVQLPGHRPWLERVWALCDLPAADRWSPADWVYCPMDVYVPTSRCLQTSRPGSECASSSCTGASALGRTTSTTA